MDSKTKTPKKELKCQRETRGWSQKRVADILNTSREMIGKWERGEQNPSKYYQEKLCELFNKTAQELDFIPDLSTSDSTQHYTFVEQQNDISSIVTKAVSEGIIAAAKELGSQDLNELRRKLLEQALGIAVASLNPLAHLPYIETSPSQPVEEFLPNSALGIKACWNMLNNGEFWFIERMLPKYVPTLKRYAQEESPFQKKAAALLSQAYQLSCELATDQENFGIAQDAGDNALVYAHIAADPYLQVSSSIRRANVHFHRKQPLLALKAYKQALPLVHEVSPLIQGRLYAGLAEVLGMCEEEQSALTYMSLAHESYPEHPEQDPAFRYTNFSRYSLYMFGEGQTQLFLRQPKEAQKTFAYVQKELVAPQSEPLVGVDLAYYQASAAIMLGELEQSSLYIQAAATLARSVNSRLYYNKILSLYQTMGKQWKHERQVVELEEFFQPW